MAFMTIWNLPTVPSFSEFCGGVFESEPSLSAVIKKPENLCVSPWEARKMPSRLTE